MEVNETIVEFRRRFAAASGSAARPGSRRARTAAERALRQTGEIPVISAPLGGMVESTTPAADPVKPRGKHHGKHHASPAALPASQQPTHAADVTDEAPEAPRYYPAGASFMAMPALTRAQIPASHTTDVLSAIAPRKGMHKVHVAALALIVAASGLGAAGTFTFDSTTAQAATSSNPTAIGEDETPGAAPVNNAVAKNVIIDVDGAVNTYRTDAVTVGAVLRQAGVLVNDHDIVDHLMSAPVFDGETIRISRITEKTIEENYTEPFQTLTENDPTMWADQRTVVQAGVNGEGTRTYRVRMRGDQEVSRELLISVERVAPVPEVVKQGTRPVAEREAEAARAAEAKRKAIVTVPAGPPVDPGSSRDIARSMLAAYGWGDDQWQCLDALWNRESGWNYQNLNRSSGAYGIPQALPGSKMASAGADWRTNPATQIRWGLGYIQGRYGSPCAAWGHSERRGWY